MAAVHVDLDGARQIYQAHGWVYTANEDPLFESGLRGALDVLERADVRATLFVIAEDMADTRKHELVRTAVASGHEIASHSLTHRRLTSLGPKARRGEIHGSRDRLATALNTGVHGFRAPGFHIDSECLELIAEAGYTYDSSLFSTSATKHLMTLGRPFRPIPQSTLLELPVPSFGRFSLPFHPSYSLVAGDWYFRTGMRIFRSTGAPFVLLFHLTDFAEPLPRMHAGGVMRRLYTLSYMSAERKRARCAAMLDAVRSEFTIGTTTELAATWRETPGALGTARPL